MPAEIRPRLLGLRFVAVRLRGPVRPVIRFLPQGWRLTLLLPKDASESRRAS